MSGSTAKDSQKSLDRYPAISEKDRFRSQPSQKKSAPHPPPSSTIITTRVPPPKKTRHPPTPHPGGLANKQGTPLTPGEGVPPLPVPVSGPAFPLNCQEKGDQGVPHAVMRGGTPCLRSRGGYPLPHADPGDPPCPPPGVHKKGTRPPFVLSMGGSPPTTRWGRAGSGKKVAGRCDDPVGGPVLGEETAITPAAGSRSLPSAAPSPGSPRAAPSWTVPWARPGSRWPCSWTPRTSRSPGQG